MPGDYEQRSLGVSSQKLFEFAALYLVKALLWSFSRSTRDYSGILKVCLPGFLSKEIENVNIEKIALDGVNRTGLGSSVFVSAPSE